MKFEVGFYTRGDLARSCLIAECVVDAANILSARTTALTQLVPKHPEIADCRYWHAAVYRPGKLKSLHHTQ
ncbi:MAG: hypothetical protein OSA97_04155 [Nevskia sp.]|nr:hypothetical protein [Nevskia sp.]